jgi:hypothetical protein
MYSTVPTVNVGLRVSCTRRCNPTIGALTCDCKDFFRFILEKEMDLSFLLLATLTWDQEVEAEDTWVRTVEVDKVRFDNFCSLR